jgi:hypothetical protein
MYPELPPQSAPNKDYLSVIGVEDYGFDSGVDWIHAFRFVCQLKKVKRQRPIGDARLIERASACFPALVLFDIKGMCTEVHSGA